MPTTPLPFLGALALTLLHAMPAAGEEHPACAAPAEVRDRLAQIRQAGCSVGQRCWDEHGAELRALRANYPHNVVVHRAYQDHFRRDDEGALREEYRALLDASPDEASLHYLYSRTFVLGSDAGREHAVRALELDASNPWARFAAYVLEARRREGTDQLVALEHMRVFFDGCPNDLENGLVYAGRLGGRATWEPWLDRLESVTASSPAFVRLEAMPLLWQARFRLARPDEHLLLRERISAQVSELERLSLQEERAYWRALEQGYEILGNEERRAAVAERLLALEPCSLDASQGRWRTFWEERGQNWMSPTYDAESASALLATSDGWLRQCPDDLFAANGRFQAVANLPELEVATVRAEIDRYLAAWEANKGRMTMGQSPYYQVARLLLDRKLDLHQIAELVEQERKLLEEQASEELPPDLPAELRQRVDGSRRLQRATLQALAVESQVALGEVQAAGLALLELEELLSVLEAGGEANLRDLVRSLRLEHELLRARLHHTAGRAAAARAALAAAARLVPDDDRFEARRRFAAAAADLGVDAEAQLVTGADRPEDGQEAESGRWEEGSTDPLPDFELVDLTGKTWRRADLLGKTTLINFWATWCGPCVAELPAVQELHEQVAGDASLLVLTFDVDDNPGLVQPFVTRHGLTMPVLFAAEPVREWWQGAISIPRTWIVDPKGVVRQRQMGFDAKERPTWAADALARMRSVASSP